MLLMKNVYAIELPEYSRVDYPSCSCSCEGRLIFQPTQLNELVLIKWAKEALHVSFDYGFGNYKTALENASQYFTRSGWDDFIDELVKSKNLDIMLNQKLIVNAKITGTPKIIKQKTIHNLQGWEIEIPIMARYSNSKLVIDKKLLVTLEIVQTSQKNNTQGLAIQQFIIQPIES